MVGTIRTKPTPTRQSRSSPEPFPTAFLVGITALAAIFAGPEAISSQVPAGPGSLSDASSLPVVFLDCQSRINCNQTQFQTEIGFVQWTNEREDADVHLIFTSQGTPAGREYALDFVGRGSHQGLSDELVYFADDSDVQSEVMDGLARTLRLGLLPYALRSGLGHDLDVVFDGTSFDRASSSRGANGAGPYPDPWNYWTFQVSLSGDLDLRETRTSTRLNPRVDADRVTEAWKLNFHTRMDMRRDRRDLADGRQVRDDRDNWRFTALVVRSITAHISVGIDADIRNSVQNNQDVRVQFNPAVEYNYFPYAEASRRQLIAHYSVGFEHSNYMEETIFGVHRETLPQHRIGVQYRAREEWGNAGVSLDANQYLHDGGFYSMGVSANLSYRIARGLEVSVSGSTSRVNDNIHTPAADISDEDILLGRQNLPSSYRYETSLGMSYRWGSSAANIVNTRFPRSVR